MSKCIAQLLSLLVADSVVAQNGSELDRFDASTTVFNVKDYGAKGDGDSDDTEYIQEAFNDLMKKKTGELKIPDGSYKCGPIKFSGLENAKIHFDGDIYMLDDIKKWQKYSKDTIWFQGDSCTNLELKGGRFHGNSAYWNQHYTPHKDDTRPTMFHFKDMTTFEMHGADLLDAPHEHIEIRSSDGVKLHDLKLEAVIDSENTDGIGLTSVTNGLVQSVSVQNGDDCLKVSGKSQGIRFEKSNCTGGHGLTLGGGADTLEVENVTYHDIHLLGMSNGARVKFTTKTEGFIRDVTWEKIRMTNVRTPMGIESTYHSKHPSSKPHFELGDLHYTNIKAKYDESQETGSGKAYSSNPGSFSCDDSAPCKKLHLTDVTIQTDAEWFCQAAKGETKNVSPEVDCLSQSDLVV